MIKTKTFIQTRPYLFATVCALAYMLLAALLNHLIAGQGGGITGFYLTKTLAAIVPIVLMVFLAYATKLVTRTDFGGGGLAKGLLFGLPLLLLFFFLYDIWPLLQAGQYRNGATLVTLILMCLMQLAVALSEELLCRGILYKTLKMRHGERGKGLLLALLMSSLIFGLMHFLNMMNGVAFLPVLTQVAAAFFIGIFFGALYIRTGSLLPAILIHMLYNTFLGLKDVLQVEAAAAPPPAEAAVVTAAAADYLVMPTITLFFALYGLFLIRKQLKKSGD